MRQIIVALMIALLPLRAWVGDAMATEMASGAPAHTQIATEKIASSAHTERAVVAFDHQSSVQPPAAAAAASDCAGHGMHAPATEVTDAPCHSCSACQACHTVALSSSVAHTDSFYKPPALTHAPAAQFASAVAALGQKPPIS